MSIGNNIKKYRRDMGMTQEDLAGVLCITSQAVSKWESGAGLPDEIDLKFRVQNPEYTGRRDNTSGLIV